MARLVVPLSAERLNLLLDIALEAARDGESISNRSGHETPGYHRRRGGGAAERRGRGAEQRKAAQGRAWGAERTPGGA